MKPALMGFQGHTIHSRDIINEEYFSNNTKNKPKNELAHPYVKTSVCQNDRESYAPMVINVSGLRFSVIESIFQKFPETLLGNKVKRMHYYHSDRKEFVFDRNRPAFEAILDYYLCGGDGLRRPYNVPMDTFLEEMEFYELDINKLGFSPKNSNTEMKVSFLKSDLKEKLWLLFEDPRSSIKARLLSIFTYAAIMIFIGIIFFESMTELKTLAFNQLFDEPVFIAETVCISWFVMEITVRFLSCPNKNNFLIDIFTIIDILSILPYFIKIGIIIAFHGKHTNSALNHFLKATELLRIARIFKLVRHAKGFQVLCKVFIASRKEIGLFLYYMIILMILFSCTVYSIESENPRSSIRSIPDGFWWAIVTLTTVGYGDVVPVGSWSKFIGSICAVSGILIVAMLIPLIMTQFSAIYNEEYDAAT